MRCDMIHKLWVASALVICTTGSPMSSLAELLVWDFTATVSDIYGDISLLPINISTGDTVQGTFSYQDYLTKANPSSTYVDIYEPLQPEASFTVTVPILTTRTVWDKYEVAVVHQSSRDNASVRNEYNEMLPEALSYNEELWVTCIDETQTLFPAWVLPTNWHTAFFSSNSSFSYSLVNGGPEDSVSVNGDIQSITLRTVPEPNTVALLFIGSGVLYLRRKRFSNHRVEHTRYNARF